MAGKQRAIGLLVSLDKGKLDVETLHPRAGDTIEIDGLPELKKVFGQLADKMALDGKISEQDGMICFWGKAKNGEETTFSHNVYQLGMPFELTVTTTRTVSARENNEQGVVLADLAPAFRQDIQLALKYSGRKLDEKLTAVSEKVTVRTLARLEWFPGMFEDSGTLYRVTRLIRKDTEWEVRFENLPAGQILVGQLPDVTLEKREMPIIQFAERKLMPSEQRVDLENLFVDVSKQDSNLTAQDLSVERSTAVTDASEAGLAEDEDQPFQQDVQPGSEQFPDSVNESQTETEYTDIQVLPDEQAEPEQHDKLAEIKRISPEMYVQQLFDQLTSRTTQSMVLPVSSDVESGPSAAGIQDVQYDQVQPISSSFRRNRSFTHVSDDLIDNILTDIDEWIR